MTEIEPVLESMALSAVALIVFLLALGILGALAQQAVLELGLRRRLNRNGAWRWAQLYSPSPWDFLRAAGMDRSHPAYSLPFAQLCAQLNNSLLALADRAPGARVVVEIARSEYLNDRYAYSTPDGVSESRDSFQEYELVATERVSSVIDRSIDRLQSKLSRTTTLSGYITGAIFSAFLAFGYLWLTTDQGAVFAFRNENWLRVWFAIIAAVFGSMLTPALQRTVERISYRK